LTAHAPYYVNLCGTAQIVARSEKRLIEAARLADLCGAHSMCFHAGFPGAQQWARATTRVRLALRRLRRQMRSEGLRVDLRPELTGAASQVGSFEDVLKWCESIEGLAPCIDFAHQYARTLGEFNGYDAFRGMLDEIGSRLGAGALQRLHVHLSGIEYGTKGERRHLALRKSRFRYRDVLQALRDANVSGWVICESPAREDDALHLKRIYRRLK
jgi:deoxyribonuclease-4